MDRLRVTAIKVDRGEQLFALRVVVVPVAADCSVPAPHLDCLVTEHIALPASKYDIYHAHKPSFDLSWFGTKHSKQKARLLPHPSPK